MRGCGKHDVMICMALGHASDPVGVDPVVLKRDSVYFDNVIRVRQNRFSRRIACLKRRLEFHIDVSNGYVDFGGEA
jgi:hypothetical protein